MSDGRTLTQLQNLTNANLLKIRAFNKINFGRNYLIAVANPLQVINQIPDTYKLASRNLINTNSESAIKKIVLHYRRGSNTLDILPGESKPRGLPNSWYLRVLRKYVEMYENLGINFTIEIFTDMPKSSFVYQPRDFQLHLLVLATSS